MTAPIVARHEKALSSVQPSSFVWLWLKTATFGLSVFGLSLLYVYIQSAKTGTFQVNQAAAGTGTVLVALSFLLTSLSFFFDRFDKLIVYRKHLGIIGFAYIVAHVVFIVFLMPWMFSLGELLNTRLASFTFGALATGIFAIMTAISNKYAVTSMGGASWRAFLRYGGYSALLLSLVHIWLATGKYWVLTKMWSLSMIVFAVGAIAIISRLLMKMVMVIKKH